MFGGQGSTRVQGFEEGRGECVAKQCSVVRAVVVFFFAGSDEFGIVRDV